MALVGVDAGRVISILGCSSNGTILIRGRPLLGAARFGTQCDIVSFRGGAGRILAGGTCLFGGFNSTCAGVDRVVPGFIRYSTTILCSEHILTICPGNRTNVFSHRNRLI